MVVPKHITLSEITDTLIKQFKVNKELYHLKLEVHYRTGSPWFHVTEIQNDKDLSVFISETSKTSLPLCVSRSLVWDAQAEVDGERRKDYATVFVEFNGEWEYEDKERIIFKNSESSTIFVPKRITLSEIFDILYKHLHVDKKLYSFNLEVQHGTEDPSEIKNNQDLSVFISETSETELRLCVTQVAEERREDKTVKNRLLKAIRKDDWRKAREIVYNNTEEVTWTSKLNDRGNTALHFAVGRYKDNEVVRDVVMEINSELLLTIENSIGAHPAHHAAIFGNREALKIMLDSNSKILFNPDFFNDLPIHSALTIPTIKTFRYLLEQMKSYKDEFDTFLRGTSGHELLGKIIEAGFIDVAYELIDNYPRMAAQVFGKDDTPLQRIIRKPDLFYNGTDYNLYQRFVYRHVPIENNSLGSTDTADIDNNSLGGTNSTADIENNNLAGGTDTADIDNNSLGGTDTAVVENQETPKRRCLHDVIWRIWVKLLEATLLHVPQVKRLKDDKVKHNTTIKLLRRICEEVDRTNTSSDIQRLYSSPFCLAVENNTDEAIEKLTTYFAGLYGSKKDGHNIYQLMVLNRSEKVYIFIMNHKRDAISDFMMVNDIDDNNILHLAGRLAPIHKLNAASGAALQMQQELQWFEEVKRVAGIAHTRKLNKRKETPMMVFRREHEKLRKEGEEWMKKTADSYTITAALIITIVFAAAITVPGGNDSATGKPIYETKSSLIIFAISDAVSLFTSTTSLLLFLSILTARYADEDFLYKLPKRLTFGLVMLFVSVTSMMIAFSATLYIMFGHEKAWILIPIAALACLPIASFVTLQFPLLVELISSTYGPGIFAKENDYWQSSANNNKKKRA